MNEFHYNVVDHDYKTIRKEARRLADATGKAYGLVLYAGQESYRSEGSLSQALSEMEKYCGTTEGENHVQETDPREGAVES